MTYVKSFSLPACGRRNRGRWNGTTLKNWNLSFVYLASSRVQPPKAPPWSRPLSAVFVVAFRLSTLNSNNPQRFDFENVTPVTPLLRLVLRLEPSKSPGFTELVTPVTAVTPQNRPSGGKEFRPASRT